MKRETNQLDVGANEACLTKKMLMPLNHMAGALSSGVQICLVAGLVIVW